MNRALDRYDAMLLDLDGTVVCGRQLVPGAAEVIDDLRQHGAAVRFITNNASRGPDEVAGHLTALGVRTEPEEVLTSGQAAVAVLSSRLPSGVAVLVVGTESLATEVRVAGFSPVTRACECPAAVLQGHSPETGWARLAEACLAIRAGALWVACNIDRTLPTERGLLPGNGAMVAALQAATDCEPVVAGKPARPLLDTAVDRAGARCPLVVGDRLDTDIAGACAAGLDSLLVLSGVADAAALLAAPPDQRPVYLAADIRVLRGSLEGTRIQVRPGWRAEPLGRADPPGGTAVLRSNGTRGCGDVGDPLDALRTLCALGWAEQGGPMRVQAGDDAAAAALQALGLVR